MLAVLWLIIWATVGDAFYDDFNWYTSDDGVSGQRAFDPQRIVRENFTNILRNYADSYIPIREGDELTMEKVKSRLRMLKIFTHMGNSNDYEPSKGKFLPLSEGAGFCTMGRQTKVGCNHCTCVAGQLYMCTGMICPKPPTKPKSVIACKEGERRRIDSCNYCYCRNGHEICSTRDCRLRHDHLLIRSQYTCREGVRRKVDCNRCICRNGEEYCSRKKCSKKKPTQMKFRQYNKMPEGHCNDGQSLKIDCRVCKCTQNRWHCSDKNCGTKKKIDDLPPNCRRGDEITVNCVPCICRKRGWKCYVKKRKRNCRPDKNEELSLAEPPQALRMTYSHYDDEPPRKCKIGERQRIDACNYCYCNRDRELVCTNNKCTYSRHVDHKYPLDIDKKQCQIGSRFRKDECNYCYCNYNRHLVCSENKCTRTRKSRYDLSDERELLRFTPAPKICLPHERFRLDNCNWCYCTNDRKRICERNPCPKSQKPDTRWPPNSPRRGCYIGSRFDRGKCEYCYCSVWRRIECRLRYNCVDNTTTTTTTMKPIIKATTQRTKPRNSFNFECEVGQIQRVDDCNVCRCTYSRTWMCTDNVCPSNYVHHDLSDERELLRFTPAPKICLPHERFRLDNCNWCYCTNDRKRICERNPCPKSQKPDTRWPPNSPRRGCYIGSRFDRGKCEYCYCSVWRRIECRLRYNCVDNTTTTTTTMKPIIKATTQRTKPRNSFNFECEVGQIQRVDDCNVCRCTYSRTWMCTDNVCPSNYDHLPMVFSEPECLVGEPVPAQDPCNVCICLDSHILCTDNPCIQRQTVGEDPMCVEGHKYYLSDVCNYCICQAGQYFCTSRACLVPGKLIPGSATCIDGEVTTGKDSCNMCVCNKGRIDCTNNPCNNLRKPKDAKSESFLSYIRTQNNKNHKKTQGTKQKCTPGKKYFPEDFDPNCPNECICDRHELLCTKRKCYNNWDKKTPFQWPLGRLQDTLKSRNVNNYLKQDTCVEYQKLPSDDPCNECICLNARKVCTTISCSDDNEGAHDSVKALFNLNVQGSKRKKGNMVKQNNNFCEPFTFFSPDDNRFCRNCFCLHNGLALCLLNLCKYSKDIPNQNSPEELDTVCNPGETGHPTKCVTCTCSAHRKWICTREELALCYERECDEKDEFHMGFFPYCAGCKCSVKEWFCSIESDTCQDFSNAICPLGTFIHNPKQHCSICLCGGYHEGSHNMCFTEAKCVRQVNSQLKMKQ